MKQYRRKGKGWYKCVVVGGVMTRVVVEARPKGRAMGQCEADWDVLNGGVELAQGHYCQKLVAVTEKSVNCVTFSVV